MQMKQSNSYWQLFPWGISLLLFILCGFLAFRIFDQAVTLDYGQSGMQLLLEQRDILRRVAESSAKGLKKEQLLHIFKKDSLSYFTKGENKLVAGQVVFYFENDKLVRIEPSN